MNIHSEAAGEGYHERKLQRNYNVNRVLFHRQSTYDKHIGRIGIVKMGKIIDKNQNGKFCTRYRDIYKSITFNGSKDTSAPNFIELLIRIRNKKCGWSDSNIQTKVVL
jgi:hypothetical protein